MVNKSTIVERLIAGKPHTPAQTVDVFAPANIALCKYWGKRNSELNLPMTDSLSLSLGVLGSHCKLSIHEGSCDCVTLNGQELPPAQPFVRRLSRFLDLFRPDNQHQFRIETVNSIPTAAGFASSASGFAAIIKALDALYGWHLPPHELSILARLGSGSASRSLWQGFVHWQAGNDVDGMDSFAVPLPDRWSDLRIGLLVLNSDRKPTGSTEAMQRTVETSALYQAWPDQVSKDLKAIRRAITEHDFHALGSTAESNALAMHATMMAARPPVLYWQSESLAAMHKIWKAREEGLAVYFTMDAGPNLKLIFREPDRVAVEQQFEGLLTANPWQE